MTATVSRSPLYQVGTRVLVQHRGQTKPGRVHAIHRSDNGTQYVVHTDGTTSDTAPGVLNLWTTSDSPLAMRPEPTQGGTSR